MRGGGGEGNVFGMGKNSSHLRYGLENQREAFRKIMEGRTGPPSDESCHKAARTGGGGGGSGTEKKSMPVYFESRVARGLS